MIVQSTPPGEYVPASDGTQLFVQRLGTSPNTVLIPNAIYMHDDFARLATDYTVILFDPRNRGRSATVEDPARLADGVELDGADIEAVRLHFGIQDLTLIGHSYLGLVIALYAMRHPARTRRVIQISPQQPYHARQYPHELCWNDDTLAQVWAGIRELQPQRPVLDPVEFCKRSWSILRPMYVADPGHTNRIQNWGFCDCPNERNFMQHWIQNINPSIQRLNLQAEDLAKITCPMLTIHGRKDRNAPYGGGLDWASDCLNARLFTVAEAAHVPWLEAPGKVWPAIETFLRGEWPAEM